MLGFNLNYVNKRVPGAYTSISNGYGDPALYNGTQHVNWKTDEV